MDKTWLNDLRNKITKIRLMWLKYLSVNLVIMIFFWVLFATAHYGDNTKEVYFVIATILSFSSFIFFSILIVSLFFRIKKRVIGDSIICFYCGVSNILYIDGIECDRCIWNDYLYGQLPDGRQVCVKQDDWTGGIKITIGKDNDLNIML